MRGFAISIRHDRHHTGPRWKPLSSPHNDLCWGQTCSNGNPRAARGWQSWRRFCLSYSWVL